MFCLHSPRTLRNSAYSSASPSYLSVLTSGTPSEQGPSFSTVAARFVCLSFPYPAGQASCQVTPVIQGPTLLSSCAPQCYWLLLLQVALDSELGQGSRFLRTGSCLPLDMRTERMSLPEQPSFSVPPARDHPHQWACTIPSSRQLFRSLPHTSRPRESHACCLIHPASASFPSAESAVGAL